MNGYNFTERTRKVLTFAREEASRLRHGYVAPQHLLLGILREGEGVASAVLRNRGIDPTKLQQSVEAASEKGESRPTGPDLPYTSRSKKVLELAMGQARKLEHQYIGTEHLLLGILEEQKGIAAQALVDAGLSYDGARNEIIAVLGTPMGADLHRTEDERRPRSAPAYPSKRLLRLLAAGKESAASTSAEAFVVALLRDAGGRANAALDALSVDRDGLLARIERLASGGTKPPIEKLLIPDPASHPASRTTLDTADFLLAILDRHAEIARAFAESGITSASLRAKLDEMEG